MGDYTNCYNRYYVLPDSFFNEEEQKRSESIGVEEKNNFYLHMHDKLFPDALPELSPLEKLDKLRDTFQNCHDLFLRLNKGWNHQAGAFLGVLGESYLKECDLTEECKLPVIQTIPDLQELISTLSRYRELIVNLCSYYKTQAGELQAIPDEKEN